MTQQTCIKYSCKVNSKSHGNGIQNKNNKNKIEKVDTCKQQLFKKENLKRLFSHCGRVKLSSHAVRNLCYMTMITIIISTERFKVV